MALQMYSHWLSLPIGVRHQIAHKLGIVKKFPTEVQDNQVKTDGYLMADIETALAIENLQKYLATDEKDHATLIRWLIEGKPELKVGDTIHLNKGDIAPAEVILVKADKPKRKYVKKNK